MFPIIMGCKDDEVVISEVLNVKDNNHLIDLPIVLRSA